MLPKKILFLSKRHSVTQFGEIASFKVNLKFKIQKLWSSKPSIGLSIIADEMKQSSCYR